MHRYNICKPNTILMLIDIKRKLNMKHPESEKTQYKHSISLYTICTTWQKNGKWYEAISNTKGVSNIIH